MADPLYAGKIGSAASASTPTAPVNSTAQRIEDAYWALLTPEHRFDRRTNCEQDRDRRTILLAIAQRAVEQRHDHRYAFRVVADTALPVNIRTEIDRTP